MSNFPCYDCENIGEETPRCKNHATCDKWNQWGVERTQETMTAFENAFDKSDTRNLTKTDLSIALYALQKIKGTNVFAVLQEGVTE